MEKFITVKESDFNILNERANLSDRNELRVVFYQHYAHLEHCYPTQTASYFVNSPIDPDFQFCVDAIKRKIDDNDAYLKACREVLNEASMERQRWQDIDNNVFKQVYKIPAWIRWLFNIKYDPTEFNDVSPD